MNTMATSVTHAGINAKTPVRRPKMLVRYGYGDKLIRAITLEMNSNISCVGNALHKITGVEVASSRSVFFFITDEQLPKYTRVS